MVYSVLLLNVSFSVHTRFTMWVCCDSNSMFSCWRLRIRIVTLVTKLNSLNHTSSSCVKLSNHLGTSAVFLGTASRKSRKHYNLNTAVHPSEISSSDMRHTLLLPKLVMVSRSSSSQVTSVHRSTRARARRSVVLEATRLQGLIDFDLVVIANLIKIDEIRSR
jgi:hypothetical protein